MYVVFVLKFNVLIYVFFNKNKRSHSRVLNRFINYLSILEVKTLIIVIINLVVLFLFGSIRIRKVIYKQPYRFILCLLKA